MTISVLTARATDTLPGRVFVVTSNADRPKALYEFLIEDDGEDTVSFSTGQSFHDDGELSAAALSKDIRQAVESAGYAIVSSEESADETPEDVRTDGGIGPLQCVCRVRGHIESAYEDDDTDRRHVRQALGGLRELADTYDIHAEELEGHLRAILDSPSEEKPFYLNRADERIDELLEVAADRAGVDAVNNRPASESGTYSPMWTGEVPHGEDDAQEALSRLRDIRGLIDSARHQDHDNAYVTLALGELRELEDDPGLRSAELQEHLELIFEKRDDWKPDLLDQADEVLDELIKAVSYEVWDEVPPDAPESPPVEIVDPAARETTEDAGGGEVEDDGTESEWATAEERPPECVRWTGEGTGILEIEITHSMAEWMALEIEGSNHETIEDWAFAHLFVDLERSIPSHTVDVEIDVPDDVAKRIALYCRHFEETGSGNVNVPDAIYNHITTRPFYMLDGQPWTLAAESVDYDYGERPSLKRAGDSATEADSEPEGGDEGSESSE